MQFLGNEVLKKTVRNWVERGQLPHAILLEGEEGVGKKTAALFIAKSFLCLNYHGSPCEQCKNCKKLSSGNLADYAVFVPEGTNRSFRVETIRKICRDVYIKPQEAERKVYLLADAQSMTAEAANALLKVLEEPPGTVHFILTCKTRTALLPTIVSRLIPLSLIPLHSEEVKLLLEEHFPLLPSDKLTQAVQKFGGNAGESIRYLSDEAVASLTELAEDYLTALIMRDGYTALRIASGLTKKENVLFFAERLLLLLRDALVLSKGKEVLYMSEETARRMSGKITAAKVVKAVEYVQKAKQYAQFNVNSGVNSTALTLQLHSILL